MKKVLCILFLATLILGTLSTAYADDRGFFSLYVQCMNENDLTYNPSSDFTQLAYKFTDNEKLYVYHTVTGGSEEYTNLFHAVQVHDSGATVRCGQKWATPTLNVPIQSNAIVVYRYYTVAARGNTKHYLYDNVTYITLNGNFSDQG